MGKNIEAFAYYHQQKEEMANYIQISSAAVSLLQRNINGVPNSPALLGSFVDACNVSHWGQNKKYKNPDKNANDVSEFMANHFVVQQVSLFDLFSRNIVSDIARFSQKARENFPELSHDHNLIALGPQGRWVITGCCNQCTDKIGNLNARLETIREWLKWSPSKSLEKTFLIFELARRIRNRIVHCGALIGSDLEDFAKSKELFDAMNVYRDEFTRGSLPPLPNFSNHRKIKMEPVHAILFGAYFYEIAKDINDYACSLMADEEFIDMGFYYSSMLDEHPFRSVKHKTAENRVNFFVNGRYLRSQQSPSAENIIRHLTSRSVVDAAGKLPIKTTTYWKVAADRHLVLSEAEQKSRT